jgi:hypothetical protein
MDLKMSNDQRTPVRPNLDIPAAAGRVLRNFEPGGAVIADNSAGGEVRPERYAPTPTRRTY